MKRASWKHIGSGLVLLIGLTLAPISVYGKEIPKHVATTPTTQTAEWAVKWWMPRHEQKLKEAANGDIDLVFIGDSITHGWENVPDLWNKYYRDRKPLNLGFSGDRTEHVLWRLDHGAIDGIQPKLAVIMIGTNNIGHKSSTPEQTVDGIRAILARLGAKHPQMKILLLAVFPRGADRNDPFRRQVEEINEHLPALADGKRVFFLDLGGKFLDKGGTLPKKLMPDLLHPNKEGYQIWAEAMEPTICRVLGDGK